MKRIICILIIVLILPMLFACSKDNSNNDNVEVMMEFNATILEIENDSILVDTNDSNVFGKYTVNVGTVTKYYDAEGKDIKKSDLKSSDKITVYYDGKVARSLPPQVYALKIQLR